MPKLKNQLPKYRKHSSGKARVTLNGRDHLLGDYGSPESHAEYDRVIAEWLASGRRPLQTESEAGVSVAEVLAGYLTFAKGYYVKNAEPTNEFDAMELVIRDTARLYAETSAESFGPMKLKAVRQVWIEKGQARPTVNKNTRRLTRIFRWAVAEEMVPGSVIHALTAVPGLKKGRCNLPEPTPILPVDLKVVEATLAYLPEVTADMIRFQLFTGARPGEVCRMKPKDIVREDDVWEYHDKDHKTVHHGRTRTVFIGPEAKAILQKYLDRPDDTVCFSMAESLEQRRHAKSLARVTPLSCGNRRNKRSARSNADPARKRRKPRQAFDTSSYRHAIHTACDKAFPAKPPLCLQEGESNAARMRRLTVKEKQELDTWQKEHRWHPNQLRHTRGTEIRKQHGLEASQVILGHASADITQIYAERDRDKAIEVARLSG